MTTQKKTLMLVTMLLLVLIMTGCARGSFRERWRADATPPAASPANTPAPVEESAEMDGLAENAEELNALLDEIDQILRDTDTKVDIP